MLDFVIDHLWQSTLVVLMAWGVASALRRYEARWRYWIWFAASMKFLVPFALIVQIGVQIPWPAGLAESVSGNWQAVAVRALSPTRTVEQSAAPITDRTDSADDAPAASLAAQLLAPQDPEPLRDAPAGASADSAGSAAGNTGGASMALAVLLVWALGSSLLLARWALSWIRLRSMLARSTPVLFESDEPGDPELRACSSVMEPGVFGVFKPVLLIPAPLVERLSRDQLLAIIRHERVHAQRYDNFTASLHMLVEAVFWFHPFVWWIGARLIEERECACDEAVLASGVDPEVYASGLIEVCDFYAQSPLLCTAGVGGGSLQARVGRIADNRRWPVPGRLVRAALAAVPGAILLVPLAIGLLEVQAVRAQQAVPQQESGLLQCVNPDVIAGLLFNSGNSGPTPTVVSDELPSDMAEIVIPPDFEWIGSRVRDMSKYGVSGIVREVTASFRTDREPEAAEDAATTALMGSGWEPGQTNSAFQPAMDARTLFGRMRLPGMACRDEQAVRVSASEIDGTTYVNYSMQVGAIALACGPAGDMQAASAARYLPRLDLPTDPANGQALGRTGGGGYSGTLSRIEFVYGGSLADITQFMAQQLLDQGWVDDARWSGSTTAGSSWIRETENGARVAGTLDVTETSASHYKIMFRLVALQ